MPASDKTSSSPTLVYELAANLDDVTPQIVGDCMEKLLAAGALDAWVVPIQMKKQRPGVTLCALCEADKRDDLARLILELTGSFGVRYRPWDRLVLDRKYEKVDTRFGPVRVKVGSIGGELMAAQPEYEDVRRNAETAGVTLREAMDAARAAAWTWKQRQEAGPHERFNS